MKKFLEMLSKKTIDIFFETYPKNKKQEFESLSSQVKRGVFLVLGEYVNDALICLSNSDVCSVRDRLVAQIENGEKPNVEEYRNAVKNSPQYEAYQAFETAFALKVAAFDFEENSFEDMDVILFSILESLSGEVSAFPFDAYQETLVLTDIGHENTREKLSVITSSKTTFPTSKVFWSQKEIAAQGKHGADVAVDEHGTLVRVAIQDGENNPLEIDEVKMAVQMALGSMVTQNGKPLTVSLAQIAREAFDLGNTNPSAEQLHICEKAMDSMLFTKSQIDCQKQFENHKKLQITETTKLLQPLVSGRKIENEAVYYNGHEVKKTAYYIYDMPVLFLYSFMINQIKTVEKETFSSGDGKKLLEKNHPDRITVERSPANSVIKRYLLQHIEGMRKKKGSYTKISFDVIANHCAINANTPSKIKTFRKNVLAILRDFQAKEEINSFEQYNHGRKIEGVEIHFSKKNHLD